MTKTIEYIRLRLRSMTLSSVLQLFAILCLLMAGAAFVFGLAYLPGHIGETLAGRNLSSDKVSAVSNFLAGTSGVLFSAVGVFYLIRNFQEQRTDGKKDAINSNVFSMLDGFTEIQKGVKFRKDYGAKAFNLLLNELNVCIEAANSIDCLKSKSEEHRLNVAFGVFYFGRKGEHSERVLKSRFLSNEELSEFNNYINHKNETLKVCDSKNPSDSECKYICDGNQHRLGHYLRRLYALIDYIATQNILSFEEKYQLAKIVRSQLSTDEQIILFFNTFFKYGQPWKAIKKGQPLSYIEMFNMIKNVPTDVLSQTEIKQYYSFIDLEVEPLTENRKSEKVKVIRKIYKSYSDALFLENQD